MSDHNTPHDPKKFTINTFISFVVIFVFAMLMMLWHGNFSHPANGKRHYSTKVIEP